MIAIKNVKMPSSCYDCPFAKNERTNDYGSFCECGILEDYETINLLEHSKYPNCPLVEQEFCDDCVSRKEVLKIYDEWFATCNIADKKESPKAKINALPLVTPIRPKGHWIKTELPSRDAHECSECGNLAIFDECRNEEMLTDFCPHCGTEMEEIEK